MNIGVRLCGAETPLCLESKVFAVTFLPISVTKKNAVSLNWELLTMEECSVCLE